MQNIRRGRPAAWCFALLLGAAPAFAGQTTSTQYQCTVDVSGGSTTCTEGVVTLTFTSGSQRVATINLAAGYVRLDAFVNACSPTGYWMHLADSPTSDGGGGDQFTTQHDAEAYDQNTSVQMFGTFNSSRSVIEPVFQSSAVTSASGCFRVQWSIMEGQVLFDPDGDPSNAPKVEVHTLHGFEHAPYLESDSEDPTGADANKWYAGINRTVYQAARSGSGVTGVCFVLSKTTTPTAASLSGLCP
ncbi:MAG TPA: hypothetical protein VIH93_07420 [Thermoanaerobaculia bacterium]